MNKGIKTEKKIMAVLTELGLVSLARNIGHVYENQEKRMERNTEARLLNTLYVKVSSLDSIVKVVGIFKNSIIIITV